MPWGVGFRSSGNLRCAHVAGLVSRNPWGQRKSNAYMGAPDTFRKRHFCLVASSPATDPDAKASCSPSHGSEEQSLLRPDESSESDSRPCPVLARFGISD